MDAGAEHMHCMLVRAFRPHTLGFIKVCGLRSSPSSDHFFGSIHFQIGTPKRPFKHWQNESRLLILFNAF